MSTTSDGGESARRQFGPAAAAYAASRYHAEGPDLAALVEAAELTGTERALDIGCGAGHTALALAPRVREVVACDVTEAMLEQAEALARERGAANVSFVAADAASLPLGTARSTSWRAGSRRITSATSAGPSARWRAFSPRVAGW